MVTLSDIQTARVRLGRAIYRTPCPLSHTLSRLCGCQTYFKLENLQMTGSFKERGALNKLLQISPAERKAGVVAASAGNHAQGVAHHATRLGIRSVIVMPKATPLVKIVNTRDLGGEVVLHGANYDEALAHAKELQQNTVLPSSTLLTTKRLSPGREPSPWNCWKKKRSLTPLSCPSVEVG
jgi:threonine dehydratase